MINIRLIRPTEFDEVRHFIQSIFPNAIIHISEEDTILLADYHGKVVGFAHVIDDVDKIIIQGLGVDRSMRGRGVGTLLMDHVIDMIEDDDRPIFLKVRPSNPVIDLYIRYGFFLKKFGPICVLVKKINN